MTEKKEKRYVNDNAQLMAEWDWEMNTEADPTRLTIGSHKKVWWLGECGHRWEAQIKSRNIGRGCPVCSGKIVLPGFNDLQTIRPDLISEWDFQRNSSYLPSQIMANSHTKVWWMCENGHSWQASPNHRVSKGRGCPYCCHNPSVLLGENDLLTVHPKIATEWHPSKNGPLLPNQVTHNSSKRVWWKCDRGHEWQTTINHRANGSGCPCCAKSMQTSFPEQAIYYYVKKSYHDAINGYTKVFNNHGMELDIYIPSLNVGIEYDGIAFHRTQKQRQRELNKYKTCRKNNIRLIRIRENVNNDVNDICDYAIFINTDLNAAILELSKLLPKLYDIDAYRDALLIREKYYSDLEQRSLAHLYPKLSKEWNYNKNNELLPNMFSAHSNVKVWWICENGHEWQSGIDSRTRGNGCPYCSNRLVLPGYNDLAYKRPNLLLEWDYTKNFISPSSVLPGSGKKAWWICSVCNHEWIAEISSRTKGHGCPQCAKAKRKKRNA